MLINLNYHICILENMGMAVTKLHPVYGAAHRSPLLRFLEITTEEGNHARNEITLPSCPRSQQKLYAIYYEGLL